VLTIYGEGAPKAIVVRGGFAEVNPEGLIVLAEQAVPVEGLDPAVIAQAIKDVEEDLADAKDDASRDKARERLEQLNTLKSALGQ
jgi:F-type H+-transporting ATPase subunit epsilon